MRKEFVKRDGGKVTTWKDMRDCDIEYGWQFKVLYLERSASSSSPFPAFFNVLLSTCGVAPCLHMDGVCIQTTYTGYTCNHLHGLHLIARPLTYGPMDI